MKGGNACGVGARSRGQRKEVVVFDERSARAHVVGLFAQLLPGVDGSKRDELAEVVMRAASSQSSLSDAWEASPGTYSRRELSRVLAKLELGVVQARANDALWCLAKDRLPKRFTLSIDLTDIPYHGEDARDSGHSIQGQAKDGTTWKHRYATAYVTHNGHRYTLVANHAPNGEKPHVSLRRIVQHLDRLGLLDRIEVVLADKGFYSVDAIRCLKEHNLAFIIPTQNKATKIKTWRKQAKNGWRTFQVGNVFAKHEPVRIALIHMPDRGKKPPETFAYATHKLHGDAKAVHITYLKRGGIESGYRLSNMARARTSSRRIETRILYFTLSMILQNAWINTKQTLATLTQTPLRFRAFLRRIQHQKTNKTPTNQT